MFYSTARLFVWLPLASLNLSKFGLTLISKESLAKCNILKGSTSFSRKPFCRQTFGRRKFSSTTRFANHPIWSTNLLFMQSTSFGQIVFGQMIWHHLEVTLFWM